MKPIQLWGIIFVIILCSVFLIKYFNIYEFFDSIPQVWYIWRSGDEISGRFSPQWNNLKERINKNNINVKMCSINTSKEPDLALYENYQKEYTNLPLVRIISSNGNRYDYNITDDYKYYSYNDRTTQSDIGGILASNKIYKMIVEKQNK